jgi:hypothetical protein
VLDDFLAILKTHSILAGDGLAWAVVGGLTADNCEPDQNSEGTDRMQAIDAIIGAASGSIKWIWVMGCVLRSNGNRLLPYATIGSSGLRAV